MKWTLHLHVANAEDASEQSALIHSGNSCHLLARKLFTSFSQSFAAFCYSNTGLCWKRTQIGVSVENIAMKTVPFLLADAPAPNAHSVLFPSKHARMQLLIKWEFLTIALFHWIHIVWRAENCKATNSRLVSYEFKYQCYSATTFRAG